MKTEIVKTEQTVNEIDWSRSQLVKSKNSSNIVLTNGIHKKDSFCGTVIIKDTYDVGAFFKDWDKSDFTPITEPITIKFIP